VQLWLLLLFFSSSHYLFVLPSDFIRNDDSLTVSHANFQTNFYFICQALFLKQRRKKWGDIVVSFFASIIHWVQHTRLSCTTCESASSTVLRILLKNYKGNLHTETRAVIIIIIIITLSRHMYAHNTQCGLYNVETTDCSEHNVLFIIWSLKINDFRVREVAYDNNNK